MPVSSRVVSSINCLALNLCIQLVWPACLPACLLIRLLYFDLDFTRKPNSGFIDFHSHAFSVLVVVDCRL